MTCLQVVTRRVDSFMGANCTRHADMSLQTWRKGLTVSDRSEGCCALDANVLVG